MTARKSDSYLDYLNKLVHEYNNLYHRSIGKKPIDADYSALTEEVEINLKAPKSKVVDRVRITKSKEYFKQRFPGKLVKRDICY